MANASPTWTVVEASKETVAVGAGIMRVQGSEEIAKTAEATVKVPLVAAPMLPFDLLDNLKSVRVTRDDGVTARHGVTGYDWASNVSMTFRLASCGDLLVLHSGTATLRLASGAEHTVCAADATCSAFTVADSALDVDALLAAVTDALPKEDRRRSRMLSGGCGAGGGGGETACYESCYYSSDGDCDDGGVGAEYSACAHGSDCYDCGPRVVPHPPSPFPPPISPSPPPPLDLNDFSLSDGGSCIQMKDQCINPTTRSGYYFGDVSWANSNLYGAPSNNIPGLPHSIVSEVAPFLTQWADRLTAGGNVRQHRPALPHEGDALLRRTSSSRASCSRGRRTTPSRRRR